jgi:RimJ/RimL family protein N-acetyltransferase
VIETERLLLRHWKKRDRAPFAALNADPEVMRFFHRPLTPEESNDNRERMEGWATRLGFTFWPVIRKADGAFLGVCGLKPITIPWPGPADLEIGWRFARAHWGQGFATEAAAAALALGLTRARRVIAMTAVGNVASRRVMERIGMSRAPELDFEHPDVPKGSPCRPHIVFAAGAC